MRASDLVMLLIILCAASYSVIHLIPPSINGARRILSETPTDLPVVIPTSVEVKVDEPAAWTPGSTLKHLQLLR